MFTFKLNTLPCLALMLEKYKFYDPLNIVS